MVLIRTILIALLLLGLQAPSPTLAHKGHQRDEAQAAKVGAPGAVMPPSEMQQQMQAHMREMEEQAPKTFPERLANWFGRMHPFAVHFPIALFPVAFVALILARRRDETVALIRSLIVVAGAAAVVAAILGWLNGGITLTDSDPILRWHRWLGTALALICGVLAGCAWRRRDSVNSLGMVYALGLIVILLMVQGFLGASVTHGMEHLVF